MQITQRTIHWFWVFVACLVCLTWFRHAWLSDDALITFRQVNHWIHGNGLVWNLNERVQAFTHPLWFFLLSTLAFLHIPVITAAFVCSLLCTALALAFLVPTSDKAPLWSWLPCILAFFSQAFWDYSSSGLENPLSYLLFALVFWAFVAEKSASLVYLLSALLFLNRQDTALLTLPLCLHIWHLDQHRIRPLLPTLTLCLGYLGFSLFYFGHPLPNTFLAKLGTSYPFADYWIRFTHYLGYSFWYDPTTLAVLAVATVAVLKCRGKVLWIWLGVMAYLLYLVRIGGDFMAGRFFALPFFASLLMLRWITIHPLWSSRRVILVPLGTAVITVILLGAKPVWQPTTHPEPMFYYGVADERSHYHKKYSLLSAHFPVAPHPWPTEKRSYPNPQLSVQWACGGAGAMGFQQPALYIIDLCALASPYLSRLPAIQHPHWRIGHNYRKLPPGFIEWLKYGSDRLQQRQLEPRFADIARVVHGPLFSWERIKAIYRINTSPAPSIDNKEP